MELIHRQKKDTPHYPDFESYQQTRRGFLRKLGAGLVLAAGLGASSCDKDDEETAETGGKPKDPAPLPGQTPAPVPAPPQIDGDMAAPVPPPKPPPRMRGEPLVVEPPRVKGTMMAPESVVPEIRGKMAAPKPVSPAGETF